MSKRGLPETVRMRHEAHYVETLSASSGRPVGRMVPIDKVDPNPDQPRQLMGDLTELKASIAEKGIIEPLIVRPRGERYGIIAGERRYQAAVQLGLTELPVVVRPADESESIELALIENLQRRDLTAFEEAQGLAALAERFQYTHEQLAKRLGRSRASVTESLSLNAMPEEVQRLCRLAGITSKSILLEIVRQRNPEAMAAFIEQITRDMGGTRRRAREAAAGRRRGRTRPFVYRYASPNRTFSLRLAFRKTRVPRDQLIAALEGIIDDLRRSEDGHIDDLRRSEDGLRSEDGRIDDPRRSEDGLRSEDGREPDGPRQPDDGLEIDDHRPEDRGSDDLRRPEDGRHRPEDRGSDDLRRPEDGREPDE